VNPRTEPFTVTPKLQTLVDELAECDRQERIELLIDLARQLPELPEHLIPLRDDAHRVPECQSPVFLFAEVAGEGRVTLHADVPIEAPTVRGFVAMLVEGLQGTRASDVLDLPTDLIQQAGMLEILGMQRVHGLHGVLKRLKATVARAQAARDASQPAS
jgi:cysteine desulfuration protein SufE